MENPIASSTDEFISGLDATIREAAERTVEVASEQFTGLALSLSEELNLAKAIKRLAATDGLSRDEFVALQFLMIMTGIPYSLQQEITDFNVEGVATEHIAALFPPDSPKAAYVLSGATTVAAVDGLSEDEEAQSRVLGQQLGLNEPLVDILIDLARRMGHAMHAGHREIVEALELKRRALIAIM